MTTRTRAKDYAAITSVAQLEKLAEQLLSEGKPVGFDTETGYYGADRKKGSVDHYWKNQMLVGFSLTNDPSWARYVPLAHDSGGNIDDPQAALEAVRELLTKGHIVAHNAKFEKAVMWKAAKINVGSEGVLDDTILDTFVTSPTCHPNFRTMIGLKDLVLYFFDHQMIHIQELWPGLPKNKEPMIRFNTLDVTPDVVAYACEDAAWVLPLRERVSIPAMKDRGFIRQLEHEIMNIMDEVERKGVSIDWDGLQRSYEEAVTFIPEMEQYVKRKFTELARRDLSELNLNSAQQMKKLLFEELGMTTTRLTKKGADNPDMEAWQRMSSDKKSLVALSNEHEAVRVLLEFREVKTMFNNRHNKWLKEFHFADDGKIHANYKQAGAEGSDDPAPGSGRFSASDPPIQGVTKKWLHTSVDLDFDPNDKKNKAKLAEFFETHKAGRDYWAGNFRDFIIASPNSYFLTYDYSQVELRMLTGASQEPSLLEAFRKDDDVHTLTAALMLNKDPYDINKDTERPIGKTFNFALLYGMGVKSLSEQLGKSLDEAQDLYNRYFAVFTNIGSWMNQARRKGVENKYAETIFGRKIPLWYLYSPKRGFQAHGARLAINGPIQGSAADYMKIAMYRAYLTLKKEKLWFDKVTIVMNQHDALTFEVDNSVDPNELRELLQPRVVFDENTTPVLAGYPAFKADWELGQRWGSSAPFSYNQKAAFVDGVWVPQAEEQINALTIKLPDNPTEKSFRDFLSEVKKTTGDTRITVSLPKGNVALPFTAGVTRTSANDLRKIFRNASMEIA